jgi:hypothetical protein
MSIRFRPAAGSRFVSRAVRFRFPPRKRELVGFDAELHRIRQIPDHQERAGAAERLADEYCAMELSSNQGKQDVIANHYPERISALFEIVGDAHLTIAEEIKSDPMAKAAMIYKAESYYRMAGMNDFADRLKARAARIEVDYLSRPPE